jgi:hypothetical protein
MRSAATQGTGLKGAKGKIEQVTCLAWNSHREPDRAFLGVSEEAVIWARFTTGNGASAWALVTAYHQPGRPPAGEYNWQPQWVLDGPTPGIVVFTRQPTEEDVRRLLKVDPMFGSELVLIDAGIDYKAWRDVIGGRPGSWLRAAVGIESR